MLLTGPLCANCVLSVLYVLSLILGNFISELSVLPTNFVIFNKIYPYSFPPARDVGANIALWIFFLNLYGFGRFKILQSD